MTTKPSNSAKVPKSSRITRPHKLIKHAPPRVFKYANLQKTYYIKSSTPFISALKHIDKKFAALNEPKNKKNKTEYITVLGMGKNIDKCLSVGLYYQDEKRHKIEVLTKTVNVLDEFEYTEGGNEEEEEEDTEYRKRAVSGIEIRIYRKIMQS